MTDRSGRAGGNFGLRVNGSPNLKLRVDGCRRLLLLIVGVLLAGCSVAAPDASLPAGAPTGSTPAPVVRPLATPAQVEIPALGVVDELEPVGIASDGSMEIPPVDEVGWFVPGVPIGAVGPSVLAGHVNYDGTPGAFLHLGKLKPGDDIIVSGKGGRRLVFDVYEVREFPKTDFDAQFVFGDRDAPELVAVTCSGDVVDHSYTHNTAVAARLVLP